MKFGTILIQKVKFPKIPPFFVSMATVEKFAQPIPIFFHKFVWLDVRSNPIKFWKDWSSRYWEICNFTIFHTFPLPWQRRPFWKFQTWTACLHMVIIVYMKFHDKRSNHLRNISHFQKYPHFFVSMATTEKFVQPIPIFFHKFL